MRERTKALAFVGAWTVALLLVWTAASAVLPRPAVSPGTVHASLVIEGPSWTMAYDATTANATAFGILREASRTLAFELDWVEYGWPYHDVFVISINSTRNDGARNLWWQYCVNGAYAQTGAANQVVRDGDVVRWVYAPPGGDDLCR